MKKIKYYIFLVLSLFLIVGFTKIEETNYEIRKINYDNIDEISNYIDGLKDESSYIFPNMLLIENPYQTNTTGLYVYFETNNPSYVEYDINVIGEDIEKLSKRLYSTEEFSKEHEYQIIGAVPGKKNEITIRIINQNGTKESISFIYNAPYIKSKSYKGLYIKEGISKVKPLDGFYVLPTREGMSLLIDNDGNIRGELATTFIQFKFKDRYLYTMSSASRILKINHLGKIEKVYEDDNFVFHHDFTIYKDDIFVLATNKKIRSNENRINDSVVKINIETGKLEEIIDFKQLLPQLYNVSKGIVSHQVLAGKGKRDNIHPNTIDYDNDGNLLISSRETSTIIKINIKDTVPKIEYLISAPSVWEGIGDYSNYLLDKNKDSKPFSGQHSSYIQNDENLLEGQYYLTIFDNNSAIMESRADFNWEGFEKSVKVPQIINRNIQTPSGAYSYFQKYLVDENNRTYELVEELELPFSYFQSSTQEKNGHIIYNSSFKGAFGEYDLERKIVKSFMLKNNNHPYRVEKIGFNQYWFN